MSAKAINELKILEFQVDKELPGGKISTGYYGINILKVQRIIGMIRDAWPNLRLGTHLHDTRGTGLANAWAALSLGVQQFDTTVAGLGGCPFASSKGAPGNICTEDFVYMCEEMGVSTRIDLARLIECARLAESIVGHPLPGKVMKAGVRPTSLVT